MAILFGRVSNVSRGGGGSAIKAAAYRSCSSLTLNATDKETNITVPLTWDYSSKTGLVYSQIHAPENAPEWVFDRQTLWQRVEDVETKQNARLAGEYTIALPKEFTVEQNIALLKDFAEEVFTSRGIIVDVNFHNDNPNNPHAHCMYALRELEEKLDGEIDFSNHRCRELQSRAFLEGVIKDAHKKLQNVHLEKNGFEQKLEWGVAKGQEATIHHGGIKEVFARNQQIILRNAEKIVADPTIVIDKLDFNKAVFTKEHIEKELEKSLQTTLKNIPVSDQSALDIYIKNELVGLVDTVLLSPKLTLINACDLKGRMLFAKTEQVELEKRFIGNIANIANKSEHSILVKEEDIAEYAPGKEFSPQQKKAIISICGGGDLSVLEGWPGAGKSTVTKEIARHYQKAGYKVVAAAPTNKAAQELEAKLGIKVYTTAALRMKWQYQRGASKVSIGLGHDYYKQPLYDLKEGVLDKKTLLILDEASMLDLATADYFVSEVVKSGAKMLPLGDNNQNQAIGSKGAFARMSSAGNRNILTEVNRHQNTDLEIKNLHIEATTALCNYDISKAISIYDQLGKVNILENEQEKERAIAGRYVAKLMDISQNKSIDITEAAKQVVISAYTNAEIKNLNNMIRASLQNAGSLAKGREFISGGIHGNSSMVELAEGDRIIFTQNLRNDDGKVVVLNNELGTVRKLVKVDAMGCGEFLVDVEGARGVRRTLIQTGQKGKIVTFRHGYAITNSAVQGASPPYKLYSTDQHSGYSSFLVGLTRHKIDCEIFAARNSLENEVFKTKDLDVEKVKEEYQAIGYEWVAGKDEDGKDIQVKADIPLWKLGLHLLANKRNDLNFAIDSSHSSVSIELQQQLQFHREQLEGLRQDLNSHENALSDFETLANTALEDIEPLNKNEERQKNNKSKNTQFELFVAQHFDLKENILFDVTDALDAPMIFANNNINSGGHQLKIEDHLSYLKAGIVSGGDVTCLNWSDLSKNDQDLLLWSYIDEEDRGKLENHYNNVRNLAEEIQDKADAASGIWQELKESGFKSHDALDGNFKVVSDYLAARVRVRDSFEQEEILNKQLRSAKVQKLLIAAIENKYSLKLKFINTSINGIEKAGDDFGGKKSSLDAERLLDNKEFKANSIEKDRELHLRSLKGGDFKEILQNSNLFVQDIMESAKEGTALSDLRHSITKATKEAGEAKAERRALAGKIIDNWDGHIDADAAKEQPSFERISSQMSFNRLTLLKHADISQEKHYFNKLFKPTLGKNSDYQEIMHSIFKVSGSELTASDITSLVKAHDGLCEHVELVSEYIEELKEKKLLVQNSLSSSKARLKEINTYQGTELPYFMGTIYKEDSNIIISRLDQLLAKTNDKKQLGKVISDNPEMLGDLKAHGLVSRIFGSEEKRAVEVNLQHLGNRIEQYIKGKNDMQALQQDVVGGNLANKLIEIDEEIRGLRSSLPNAHELNILEEIGGLQDSVLKSGTKQQDITRFSKKINKLLLADSAQDALFAYQTKHNVIFESKSSNADKASTDKKLAATTIAKFPENELKQQFKQKANRVIKQKMLQAQQNSKPKLTFNEVKAGLSESVISEIFHRYGANINPDAKIEKKGQQFKLGSLQMSVSGSKMGLWHRFSNGSKGDIFSFVEEATGCSKYEALEIVASHAGIVASSDNAQRNRVEHKQIPGNKTTQEQSVANKDVWQAYAIVPESVAQFNAKTDLAFIEKKGGRITHSHAYRNQHNQILGYAVRIEEKASGNKQVLPVTYCHNEAQERSRWRLKGFSDAGTKPIYGIEKIATYPDKPVLIVEGEKTADAASKLLPEYNVISWMGGAQAVNKVDWAKLSNRVVSIWPDNDKPGIEAAKNIANHIDCHNGFSGLVSIVDTAKLNLPEKWDLADDVPKNSKLSGISFNDALNSHKINNATFEMAQTKDSLLDSITMLAARGKISEDNYSSKLVYRDTIAVIAQSKSIDLDAIKDHKEFISAISNIQHEYNSLHTEYSANMSTVNNSYHDSRSGHKNPDTKENLANDFVRDISVLHQLQLGVNRITKTHSEHISETVNAEMKKMQRFTDSDKEHTANNIYKEINKPEWIEQLNTKNYEKANVHLEKYRESVHINSVLSGFETEKQLCKTPNAIIKVLAKEQEFLVGLHGNLQYSEYNSSKTHELIADAKSNQEKAVFKDLEQALKSNQKQGVKSDLELVGILKNKDMNISKMAGQLTAVAKGEQDYHLRGMSIQMTCLEKLDHKVDKDQLVRDIKSMNSIEKDKHIDSIVTKATREYIDPILAKHAEDKEKATNMSEMMSALAKEHKTYLHLHTEHKNSIYIMGDKQIARNMMNAQSLESTAGIKQLSEVANHAVDLGIKNKNEMMGHLKEHANIHALYKDLQRECHDHHRNQIDKHLEDLSKNREIYINKHLFKDPSSYLNHIKTHNSHSCIPIDHINKQLQHNEQKYEHEMQKELNMHKGMGGHSL